MKHFFAEKVEHYEPICSAVGIQFETSLTYDSGSTPWVSVDRHRLEQMLTNVIENSLRYTPSGGTIGLHATLERYHLRIDVHDTGPGFFEADLKHVFDRFYQGDPARSRQHGRLGLGLPIVKLLAEKHGGTVAIGNRATGGAWVSIRIAVEPIEPTDIGDDT